MDIDENKLLEITGRRTVRRCIRKTVAAIIQRWRSYESPANVKARCLLAIYDLLRTRSDFQTEGDLVYYLFGNQHTKSKVYWHVEGQLKRDAGIRSFDGPKEIELEVFHEFDHQKEGNDRELLMEKLSDIFYNKDVLTWEEKVVLAFSFNLSLMEEEREDTDLDMWSLEELSVVLQKNQAEVAAMRKRALKKIKPHLRQ